MTYVEFLYDYRIRVEKTCCYSGHVSTSYTWPWYLRTPIRCGTVLAAFEVRPSVRFAPCGRKRFVCPQFVDVTLNDGLHPTRLIEVPRDILRLHEATDAAVLAHDLGLSVSGVQEWLDSGFVRRIEPRLYEGWDHLDAKVAHDRRLRTD